MSAVHCRSARSHNKNTDLRTCQIYELVFRYRIAKALDVVRVPFVNDLDVLPLEKARHLRLPCENRRYQFSGYLLLQLVRMGDVPLLQAEFTLTAEQQHKLHLQ